MTGKPRGVGKLTGAAGPDVGQGNHTEQIENI